MKKFTKPLILLIALLVVWQVVRLTTRKPGRPDPEQALSVQLDPAAIGRIEINRGAESVTLLNGAGGWQVKTALGIMLADSAAVAGALASLGSINTTDIMSHNPARQTEYNVQEGGGTRVRFYGRNDETLEDLIIGKLGGFESQQTAIQQGRIDESSFYTYMRRGGGDNVYKVQGFFGGLLGTDSDQWRNHDLLKFNPEDLRQIRLALSGGETVTAERDTSGSWRLAGPHSAAAADSLALERIASSLSTLRASGFVDSLVPQEQLGFGSPTVEVGIRLADGSEQQVVVGAKTGDNLYYSMKKDDPQIYTLAEFRVSQIMKSPAELILNPGGAKKEE